MGRKEELQGSPGCAVRQGALRSVRPCGRPSFGNDYGGTTLMWKIIDVIVSTAGALVVVTV